MNLKLPEDWEELNEKEIIERLKIGEEPDLKTLQLLSSLNSNYQIKELVESIAYKKLPLEWQELGDGDPCYRNECIADKLREGNITDSFIFDILAKSSDDSIREAVALSTKTSMSILEVLSKEEENDNDYYKIQSSAKRTLKKKLIESRESNIKPKTIYMKSDPAGIIFFIELNENLIELLKKSISNKELDDKLVYLWSEENLKSNSHIGVFNYGKEGEKGNEGLIEIDKTKTVEIPLNKKNNALKDGFYYLSLSLTKGSIQFEFLPDDDKEYDPQKLTEVSLPLKIDKKFFKLHDNLFHHLQTEDGTSEFNVITGFKYNGQELIEYDKELIDRDYDTLKSIIEVNSGKSEIVYSWYNYDEKWFT